MSTRGGYDPNAWASKRKDAMERAKKLREDRARAGPGGDLGEDVSEQQHKQGGEDRKGGFDDMVVGRGHDAKGLVGGGGAIGDDGLTAAERSLQQLASDSLDEFYQDEQVKENMSTANVGYRGFTTFGNNNRGGVNLNATGGSSGSVPSPSGSDTLTSEVRQRGDVKVPMEEQYQSQFMQQMQKSSVSPQHAKTTTTPYLYDPQQHSLANQPLKVDEPAVPPRGRGRGSRNPSGETRKKTRKNKPAPPPYEDEGVGQQYADGAEEEQVEEAPIRKPVRKMKEKDVQKIQSKMADMNFDVDDGAPAAPSMQQSQSTSPSARGEWKHKNTRDMSDLWTSPPRDKKERKKRTLPPKTEQTSQSMHAMVEQPIQDPPTSAPAGQHWSHAIDAGNDEDNKLSVLQQRMRSRQQQRNSRSAGTMLPSSSSRKPQNSDFATQKGAFNAQTKVSASVDASTIKYRAQTTPDYSPRTSPRVQAAAEKNRQGKGKRVRKPKPLPEWNTDTEVDTDKIYGAIDGGEIGGGGGQEQEYQENYEQQPKPRQRRSKPDWNSDFVEDNSMEREDPYAAQRERQDAQRTDQRRKEKALKEAEAREARERESRQRRQTKPKPEWSTDATPQLSAFEQEQEDYRRQMGLGGGGGVDMGGGGGGMARKKEKDQMAFDAYEQSYQQSQKMPSKKEQEAAMFDQYEDNYQKQARGGARGGGGGGGGGGRRQPPPRPSARQQREEQQQRQYDQYDDRSPQQQQQQQQQLRQAPPMESPRIPAASAAPTEFNVPEDAPVDLIACQDCGKSFAPPTYNKICKTMNNKGELKCIAMYVKKRKVFNSAKVRIQGNEHLDKDAQKLAIKARKEVVAEKKGLKPKTKKKSDKWKAESNNFRQAMRDNRLMEKAKKEGKPLTYYLD
ncbi:hypothetical protein TrVE_jg6732 [Triparma verrucosa]|uniref:Uncharacterized protein n=1 Tax=Triparma verrucosa TaxID=1606542 RepID=A0A9W7BU37_9STRA|nr:hypothetical protein TrVE_jg6732 [Triparma verrucosa]